MTISSLMIENAYMQTAYEELMKLKMKKQFSNGEANTSNDKAINSEDFLAGRLKITNSVKESFSNSFQ